MRERFDRDYIESELERIGKALESSMTVYLIGGGSMSFQELKETTKDIDLIVTDGEDLRVLQGVLTANGYDVVKEPSGEYDDLGATRILENQDGCRIDIFNRRVMDKLVLSEEMCERSETYLDTGTLSVALVSTEDIFLFKAVAGRADDIEDMFTLVQTGLDFDVIETELDQQIELLGQELFVTFVNEALSELEERHEVSTPLADTVGEITERVYRELEVLQAFDDSVAEAELRGRVDLSNTEIDDVLQRLESKDVITVANGSVRKNSPSV
jgi:hypothetical protein